MPANTYFGNYIYAMNTPNSTFDYSYSYINNFISVIQYDHLTMEFTEIIECDDNLIYNAHSYINGSLFLTFSSFDHSYQLYKLDLEQLQTNNQNITSDEAKLFPNPTSEKIQLSTFDYNSTYTIYSIAGSIMQKGVLSADGTLDVSSLNEGLHIINYTSNNKTTSAKFLKME